MNQVKWSYNESTTNKNNENQITSNKASNKASNKKSNKAKINQNNSNI